MAEICLFENLEYEGAKKKSKQLSIFCFVFFLFHNFKKINIYGNILSSEFKNVFMEHGALDL